MSRQTVYRYNRYTLMPMIAGGLLFVFCVAIGIAALIGHVDDALSCAVACACLALFSAAVAALPGLLKSDVIVDERALRWSFFGRSWRTLPWAQVCRVRIGAVVDRVRYYPKVGLTNCYIIDQKKAGWLFLRNGSILFDDSIDRVNDLLDEINVHIKSRNIEIVDYRVKPPQRLEHL